jgi:SagB-type dehydrogenase family enzyme
MLADSSGISLVHGLHGSRFELSIDLLEVVTQILKGVPVERALAGQPDGAREAIETLVTEQLLVPRRETSTGDGEDPFRNRLDPIALALHRGLNEGGYFPAMIDRAHPPAAEKTIDGARSIDLESSSLLRPDASLVKCLETRRSIRSYSVQPMEKAAFASFLQLTARAHAVIDTPDLGRLSLRNYPSGGARYPLEVYPVVYEVSEVDAGIYHYHPFHHRLVAIDSEAGHRARLRDTVRRMMDRAVDSPGDPAVLLLVTAVFARMCWKYRGIPYHLILQEVGALYQTMYLAATLLDLAPCAVGAFPELAVGQLLGLDTRDEAQVGLFALGMPDAPAERVPAIADIRMLERSPFSRDARPAVEIQFDDGRAEIRDLLDLDVDRNPDGRTFCPVMRGRHRAELAPELAARLSAWSRARRDSAPAS